MPKITLVDKTQNSLYSFLPKFNSTFNQHHYGQQVQLSNERLLPNELAIHLHIPFCHSRCHPCRCNESSLKIDSKELRRYLERMMSEIGMRAKLFDEGRVVTQIYFWGAAAKLLSTDQLAELLDELTTQFHLNRPTILELGIDINPYTMSKEGISDLLSVGFSRFNVSIQVTDKEEILTKVTSTSQQSALDIIRAVADAGGTANVNIMANKPGLCTKEFSASLAQLTDTGVSRIRVHNPFFKTLDPRNVNFKIVPGILSTQSEVSEFAGTALSSANYLHIGMSQYVLPNDPLANAFYQDLLTYNSLGYGIDQDTDLVGIGLGAISQLDSVYAQNTKSVSCYCEMINNKSLAITSGIVLSSDRRIRSAIVEQIICRSKVDLSQNISRFIDRNSKLTLFQYFTNELNELQNYARKNIIAMTDEGFEITPQGQFHKKRIAAIFSSDSTHIQSSNNESIIRFYN